MRLLTSSVHAELAQLTPEQLQQQSIHRKAARGIILDGDNILLLYTERYHDYSLPGGGVDEGEAIEAGLIRELAEETGAQNIQVMAEFGRYEEYRPWSRDDVEVMHTIASSDKKGMSIERETFLLKRIVAELLTVAA